jgi:hypothetical protein
LYKNSQKKAIVFLVFLIATLAFSMVSFAVPFARAESTDPSPKIIILPPAGPPGIPATVKGANFNPGATVAISWFGFILDVPGIQGHVGYHAIKTGITVASNGSFVTTIMVPNDFSDIVHFVNATQNGVGTGITNATFTVVPALVLSPQPANYNDGQQVLIHVVGAPLGAIAVAMGLPTVGQPGEATVIKLTYDNNQWGFVTSHLTTEGPIVTAGLTGGDIGGNATIRFNAVGEVGQHIIRGYIGTKDSPPYLPCEIGGGATFTIVGPSPDSQAILNALGPLGGLSGNVTDVKNGVTTAQTNLGAIKGSTDSTATYVLAAAALSVVNLIILLAVASRVFRKT